MQSAGPAGAVLRHTYLDVSGAHRSAYPTRKVHGCGTGRSQRTPGGLQIAASLDGYPG